MTDDLRKLLGEVTPGPWFIGTKDPDRGIWIGGRGSENGGAVLPYLFIGHTINWPANFEANARLIAMAPDLARRVIELEAESASLRERVAGLEVALVDERALSDNIADTLQDASDALGHAVSEIADLENVLSRDNQNWRMADAAKLGCEQSLSLHSTARAALSKEGA